MGGITPEARKTLLKLISEYGYSLARIEGERDLMKTLEQQAADDCGMEAKIFRAVATAYHRDHVEDAREELTEKLDAFDVVRDEGAV